MSPPLTQLQALDAKLEAKARQATRLAEGRALVTERGVRPKAPDYSRCDNALEMEAVKMGWDLDVYREIVSEDEPTSIKALAALSASLDGARSLSADEKHRARLVRLGIERDEPELPDEIRVKLAARGLNPDLASLRNADELAALRAKR